MQTKPNRFQIHTNGKMRSIATPSGRGGLFYDWIALTRYSEADPEACGPVIFLSEGADLAPPDLEVTSEIAVATDSDVEIRAVTLTNHSQRDRKIEVTTYAEIALNHPMGDAGHPAFSKLFVQTYISDDHSTLFARRRPRGTNENWPWMAQRICGDITDVSWETNRATFLGRGRALTDPISIDESGPLTCQTGNVLDPVMAWRFSVTVGAGQSQTFHILTAAAPTEEDSLSAISQVVDPSPQSALESARSAYAAKLSSLSISNESAEKFETLAGKLLSGDLPKIAPRSLDGSDVVHRHPLASDELRIIATEGMNSVGTRDLLTALPLWNHLGLKPRVFVMQEGGDGATLDQVTYVDPASFSVEEMEWWLASAQLVVGAELPTFDQAGVKSPQSNTHSTSPDSPADPGEPLLHFNGYGGFPAGGKEYIIPLDLENGRLRLPPMPWVNILANPRFGCMITERGAGYTWARNSQANRISPWSNDPIRDPHGEAFYITDENTGEIWSPLPGPCVPKSAFTVRHGFGRTRFISQVDSLSQTVDFFVPPADPVKLSLIQLKNESDQTRRLSFATWHQLLLCPTADRHHATLAWSDDSGIQHAVNPRAGAFAGGRAFAFTAVLGSGSASHLSTNSTAAFHGAGTNASPAALAPNSWEQSRGFGRDACFASRATFTLLPGEEIEILVCLGEALSENEVSTLVHRYHQPGAVRAAMDETACYWEKMTGSIQVSTPLSEVNLMINGWLIYQNLACRIWGRSAFYQSGGAFGFRDQLQDSGALASLHPSLMRSQILLHAAQQFPEGDVTHWWHPAPMGTGMRTKFSDDLLWLPYLTGHYIDTTGDLTVLEELQAFIEGPLLADHEDEEYMQPAISSTSVSVLEHCLLAIDRSLTKGEHGLPLIGIGDWNDGMSRIGREGRGESVWMGFFLITILDRWIPLCRQYREEQRADIYDEYRKDLLEAINGPGWDGEWYRRAYYDDGTPLGTKEGDECKIDALAQAWAIISGAAPEDRANLSLDSLERELIDPEYDIIRLLHPPFVNTPHDPGYIKGYVAGVRENGGQYTHAACWVIRAMAEAGRRDTAARLLQRLSPVWHSRDSQAVARYQVEPYVVAADIYGTEPHNGRGGWTWYTGSAGWMFRVAVESILGFTVENGTTCVLNPKIPDSWPGFTLSYRLPSGNTSCRIEVTVRNSDASAVSTAMLDGIAVNVENGIARWTLPDDGEEHLVEVTMGEK